MKKLIYMSIILCIIILIFGCEKSLECPNPDDKPPIDTTKLMGKLDTIWTVKIKEGLNSTHNNNLFSIEDGIIFVGSGNSNAIVSKYEKNMGGIQWIWEPNEANFPSSNLYGHRILLQNEWDIYSLDINNGELNNHYKEQNHNDAHSYGQILGDHYYFTIRRKDNSQAWLIRSKVEDLQKWDTIYTLNRGSETGNERPNIQSYNLWIDPASGDSLLIFQHRVPYRVNIVAWNMDKQEVMWKHDDLTKLGNSNHQQVLIYENKAYFGGGTTFYCFDMFSGEIIWQFDHPSGINSFMIYKPVIAIQENTIIVKDGAGVFRGFDLMTGMVRMTNQGSGHSTVSSGSPIYHKGIVYFTEKSLLYAIRASSGQLLWSERSSSIPLGYTNFRGELAIDEERGILYATDSDELFAIRLYED